MNYTVFAAHKNAANMTQQQKNTQNLKKNIKRIKVKISAASNWLGLLVPVHF